MLNVTFLAHSGFLAELDSVLLLFDWWQGDLPPLPEGKPLLVFASHSHHDHFDPRIFALDDGTRPVQFLLGKDIRLSPGNRRRWGLPEATAEKCVRLAGDQSISPLPGVEVLTLPSTDAGVAFLVEAEGKTLYHAGDLHWWHWFGEPDPWNPNMERDFKRYTEPLRGRRIDLAMVPLDPRLEGAEDWGLLWLLELAELRQVLPMHQWEDYSPTERFLTAHPEWADRILPITGRGQVFRLE